MASLQDFAAMFGAATSGAEGVATGVQQVTQKTIETEQKLIDTIDEAKTGIAAWGATTLLFQGITAFTLLYIAGKISKKTRDEE